MLKIRVKVGNINNLSEARYCAGMGVDMLGFSIGGSQDAIDPQRYKEITGWISGPTPVIEWAGTSIPIDFAALLQSYNAACVQIHARDLQNIHGLGLQIIVSVPIADWSRYSAEIRNHREIVYVELTELQGNPSWRQQVNDIAGEVPLLVGSIDDVILDAVIGLPVKGISLQGSKENGPGLMEYDRLAAILERLEIADE